MGHINKFSATSTEDKTSSTIRVLQLVPTANCPPMLEGHEWYNLSEVLFANLETLKLLSGRFVVFLDQRNMNTELEARKNFALLLP